MLPPDLDTLIRALDASLHPRVSAWTNEADRLAALQEEFAWSAGDGAHDLEFARSFAQNLPVPGAEPEQYLNRWLEVMPGLTVLSGPRFRGLDPNKPFVEIVGGNRPVQHSDLPCIAEAVRREYRVFQPLYARLWNALPSGAWPGTRPDMRLLAAPLSALRQRPVPAELRAEPARSLDFYPRYAAVYERTFRENQAHREYARLETREDLAELLGAGTLLEVLVGGEWAGIVAGRPDLQRGLRGAAVVELTLDHAFRGRGYGAALSALLARALPQPDAEFLLGTVHADNAPAYRAALRSGRFDLGGEVLWPL